MREWRKRNPEKNRATKQRAKAKSQEADKAYMAEWRDRNRERTRQYARDYYRQHQGEIATWREANRQELNRRTSEWAKAHPNERVMYSHRRRARRIGTFESGSYTVAEWLEVCERANHRCLACGLEKKLTVDHIVPFSKGGTNTIDNIQPLCFRCNQLKKAETTDYRPANLEGVITAVREQVSAEGADAETRLAEIKALVNA